MAQRLYDFIRSKPLGCFNDHQRVWITQRFIEIDRLARERAV